MAFGQNLLHLFVRSVRILLVLKFKMRGGTVTLGDNKAETLGSRLYLIDFGHRLLSVGLTAIPIAQGKAAGVAVAAIGRVGKESCEPSLFSPGSPFTPPPSLDFFRLVLHSADP